MRSRTSTHSITRNNADKPILRICLLSKIGFLTSERIIAVLASSEAGFVTGASLTINGGFAA
jgi:NAD(P)-dependent dehydrogenase (short-subunit alcohol dehydrogenase family)